MSETAIRVENLGKQFRIGGQQDRYRTLRDTLADAAMTPVRVARSLVGRNGYLRARHETFWALKEVSFEVSSGEVLGVIGRNGAGKSTLLKILSRITEPTEGHAEVHGRVGSLLEVGTGFHPELSGRENIFLNGTILGMKRAEIERKFDEIVEFAEVEKFIDTPVKHYSSGMYLRLAFGVAAHLEPEILVVDEVLAVGDAQFQKKCLGKMQDVAGQGRTILLVSHNMASIQALCQRVMVLQEGRVVLIDEPEVAIRKYLEERATVGEGALDLSAHPNRVTHSDSPIFQSLRLLDHEGRETASFIMRDQIVFEIVMDTHGNEWNTPLISIAIDRLGTRICTLSTHRMVRDPFRLTGRATLRCHWDTGWLAPGLYTIARLSIKNVQKGDRLDTIEDVLTFEITPRDIYGTGRLAPENALLVANGRWEFETGVSVKR